MDRDHLEAFIWQHWPTRGTLADRSVTAILDAADAYAATAGTARRHKRRQPRQWLLPEQWCVRPPGRVLRHTSDTDLYPLIGALADALLDAQPGERAA